MNQYRQSWPARITAVGFILTLICGNFWALGALLGVSPSEWVVHGMSIGMVAVMIGGLGLLGKAMLFRMSRREDAEDSESDSGKAL